MVPGVLFRSAGVIFNSNYFMANCQEYQELDNKSRLILIGSVVHLLQNDSESFIALSSMVRSAEQNGLFEDVTFLPETRPKQVPGSKWICACDTDSFNYIPQLIEPRYFEKAKEEECELFDTLAPCQKECDRLNSQ